MPKKSKKSAEAEAAAPSNELLTGAQPEPVESAEPASQEAIAPAGPKRKTAAKKAPAKKAPAKKTAAKKSARQPATPAADEGPVTAIPADTETAAEVEADVSAQAAMVAEDAVEANGPLEVLVPEPETDEPLSDEIAAKDESGFEPEPRAPAKLERLQKILAQAGIASRRHAEELITEGRVQVNGQVVTTLGSKADPSRDHIRVDGKLLHGAERLRYFMLNKPRGYVTTVSDPEGRPTVMEFFKKAGERLYPVGRLDYLSEGLLLVTNDGELANKLTRAASGVEKTYLVKVSGQPTEQEIDTLREGVRIDRAKPGEGSVQTAPARVRQVRIGENPWYEVVLIEGRNRELRKMFEEIGHFVEKIRRVGYGPLVLDLEPGQVRELDDQEMNLLRRAADGKWKPKRIKTSAMLPKEAGRTVDLEAGKRRGGKPSGPPATSGSPSAGPRRWGDKPFLAGKARPGQSDRSEGRTGGQDRGSSPRRPPLQDRGFAPRTDDQGQRRDAGRTFGRPAAGGDRRSFAKPPADRAEGRGFGKPPINRGEGRGFAKPPAERGGELRSFPRPEVGGAGQRPFRDRPASGGRTAPGGRPPAGGTGKTRFERAAFPARPRGPGGNTGGDAGFGERKPFRPRTDRPVRAPGDKSRWVPRTGKPAGRDSDDRARPAQGTGRSFGSGPRGVGRTGAPPRRDTGTGVRGAARPSPGVRAPGGGAGSFSTGRPRVDSGARPPAGGQGRTGFQTRGPAGGGSRPPGGRPAGGSRSGSNGASRPGFKSKPGGRGPNRGSGGWGRKRS
jgi:23S rRNA pseudouridine2605 synthase